MNTIEIQNNASLQNPEDKFEDLISQTIIDQINEQSETPKKVDFLMAELPLHIGVDEILNCPPGTVSVTNSPFCIYEGKIVLLPRIMRPDKNFTTNGSVQSEVEAMVLEIDALQNGIKEKKLELRQIIEAPEGVSVEDVRITPNTDGTFTICGVLYYGLKEKDGEKYHDVCLGLVVWDPEKDEKVKLEPILSGKKNGVVLDDHNLLCRDMKDIKNIKVARRDGDQGEWVIGENLQGFWENFPEELKDKIIRIGPGTNPVYIPELNGWIAGFHWVFRDKDVQKEGEDAEYYVGGLILMDSIDPPRVVKIEPYAISPMDSTPESLNDNLFAQIDNKHVAFPMGAGRVNIEGQDSLVISGGLNDKIIHFNSVPISKLVERFS